MYARKCSDPPGGNRRGDSQPLRPIVSGGVRALASYPKKASSRSCPRTPGCSGRGRMRRGLRHGMHTFPSLVGKDEPNKHDRYISRSRGFAVLRRGRCPARYKSARAGQGPQTVGLARLMERTHEKSADPLSGSDILSKRDYAYEVHEWIASAALLGGLLRPAFLGLFAAGYRLCRSDSRPRSPYWWTRSHSVCLRVR